MRVIAWVWLICILLICMSIKSWLITVKPIHIFPIKEVYGGQYRGKSIKQVRIHSRFSWWRWIYYASIEKTKRYDEGCQIYDYLCLYQDTRHSKDLGWIQKVLKCGYLSKRNDGMTELRIQGFASCETILVLLKPFIRFKQKQVSLVLSACQILNKKTMRTLTNTDKKKLVKIILALQNNNYATRTKKEEKDLHSMLDMTP